MRQRPARQLARLFRLSCLEWDDLLRAQVYLIAAQVLVWTRPIGRLVVQASANEPPSASGHWASEPNARRLAVAIRRVAEHGLLRPRCLVRAVALNWMLERHGVCGSRIRIGVRIDEGRLAAHAWVELGGLVLGDFVEHTGKFTPLMDGRVRLMPNDARRRS